MHLEKVEGAFASADQKIEKISVPHLGDVLLALGSRAARQKGMINMKVFTIECSGVDYANAFNNLLKKCERVVIGSWLTPLL